MSRGVYPGSFNPPTVGHLAIIEAALAQLGLSRLDLMVSRSPLAKAAAVRPTLEHRIEVVSASVAHLDRVRVVVTDLQLIADMAEPYDVVVMGADKWDQVNDPVFYADLHQRDAAVARLPRLAIAPRGDASVPEPVLLDVGAPIQHVSSTAARAGARALMTEPAAAFDARTGAWSDAARYDAWLAASS